MKNQQSIIKIWGRWGGGNTHGGHHKNHNHNHHYHPSYDNGGYGKGR